MVALENVNNCAFGRQQWLEGLGTMLLVAIGRRGRGRAGLGIEAQSAEGRAHEGRESEGEEAMDGKAFV